MVVPRPYLYNDKRVKRITRPGVGDNGGYHHTWRIEYEEATQAASECTEEIANELIQSFNFKQVTKVVDFFWHGHTVPEEVSFYVPQDTDVRRQTSSKRCGLS